MWDFPTCNIIVHSINIHIFVQPRRKQLALAFLALKCLGNKEKEEEKEKCNQKCKKRVHRQMMINCKAWH